MNEILIWTLIIIAVGLTIQFIVLSVRHENILREHTRAIRELSSNTEHNKPWDFTEKVKGIYKYVQIIAWICVFFCGCVCVHYIVVFYPRFTNKNTNGRYVESLGVDYWGIIVGFLTLLVTLLVGWQIFSNIKERERLENLTDENDSFKNNVNKLIQPWKTRLTELENCCKDGRDEIKRIDEKIDKVNNASLLLLTAQGLIKASKFEDKESKTDIQFISMAYSSLWNATLQFIESHSDKRNIFACISQMKTCLMILGIDELQLIKEHFDSAIKIYEEIKSMNGIGDDILKELQDINQLQSKIRWSQEWEDMRSAIRKWEEKRKNIESSDETSSSPIQPPTNRPSTKQSQKNH